MNESTQNDRPASLAQNFELSLSDFIESHNRRVINELPLEQRLSKLKMTSDDWWFFYEQQGDIEDLDMCIDFRSQLVALMPDDSPDRAVELNTLGRCFRVRYEHLVDLEDLQKAIQCQELAVSLISSVHFERPALLAGLGTSLWRRFERLGDFADLEKAIECHSQAVLLAPDDHTEKPVFLNSLAISLLSRSEHAVDLFDINRAIESQLQAVSLTLDNDDRKSGFLTSLGISLGSRFERLGNMADLDESIQFQQRAAELRSDSHEGKPRVLSNLGNSYQQRFERLGDLDDINKTIQLQQQAVSLSVHEHIEMPGFLASLGTAYRIRGGHLGDRRDIDRAIESQAKAIQLIPDGHPSKSRFLDDLGTSYQSRFLRLGELADIDNAIKYHSLAVSLRPDGHEGKAGVLTNLGYSYQSRFRHLGNIIDLDNAIDCQQQAVSLTPDYYPQKARFLNNLGMAHRNRAQRNNELPDVDDSIKYQQQAVLLTPDDSPEKFKFLCGLVDSYQLRFSHSKNLVDLEKAVTYQKQAASSVPDNFTEKPSFLISLGSLSLHRFEYSNNLEDIDQGIEHYQQANMLISDDSPQKPDVLQSMGFSFQLRFKLCDDLADIDNAIECQQKSLSLLPNDHTQRATICLHLASSYETRFDRLGALTDIEYAIEYFRQSATSITGSFLVAFESARLWIKLSAQHNKTPNLDAYRAAIDLIPRLIPLEDTVQRRYVDTVHLGDLITEAAAGAISLEQHTCALEWLEEGRSIVWGQRLQLRTPMDELRAMDAKLADQLEIVGKSLEMAGAFKVDADWALDRPIMPEDAAQRQRRLAADWSRLVNEARKLPGFESFLKPRNLAQLAPAAERGPVIIVNVHTTRCDALVLLPNTQTVTHIPLPSFSHKKAAQAQVNWSQSLQQYGARDRGFIRPGNAKPNRSLFEYVLNMLWTDVVEPIFSHMEFLRIQHEEQLPHVTWCATGPLAFLPIHAAGCYNKSRAQFKIYDYAITSYTPTLSGLLAPNKRPEDFSGILAIAQEETPGLSSLPCALEELDRIQQAAKAFPLKLLKGDESTVEAVLKGMEDYTWVHLACHAIQDIRDPTDSALFLSDGKLSLAAIAQRPLKHGGLAFLSACQTAVGHRELPEEAIHLAAGMIMAGYTTVIGSMWSIKDKHAPLIAERVYAGLLEGGVPDSRRAAKALHEAIGYLRTEVGEDKYEDWAPFVHIGL